MIHLSRTVMGYLYGGCYGIVAPPSSDLVWINDADLADPPGWLISAMRPSGTPHGFLPETSEVDPYSGDLVYEPHPAAKLDTDFQRLLKARREQKGWDH